MEPTNGVRPAGEFNIVVIGTGNPNRGDDAVGVEFSRRIRQSVPAGVAVLEHDGEPASLIEGWEGADAVFVVDAVHAQDSRRVFRFDAYTKPLPVEFFRLSTHAMGVAEAIELGRALGELPQTFVVYGVRGERFDHSIGLSPEVDEACDQVVSSVLEEIRAFQQHGGRRDTSRA